MKHIRSSILGLALCWLLAGTATGQIVFFNTIGNGAPMAGQAVLPTDVWSWIPQSHYAGPHQATSVGFAVAPTTAGAEIGTLSLELALAPTPGGLPLWDEVVPAGSFTVDLFTGVFTDNGLQVGAAQAPFDALFPNADYYLGVRVTGGDYALVGSTWAYEGLSPDGSGGWVSGRGPGLEVSGFCVPEPGQWGLIAALGLLGFAAWSRRI